MNWNLTADHQPVEGQLVRAKIDDERGLRNESNLRYQNRLWWLPDGSMYVYYTPTHWFPIHEQRPD